MLALHTIMDLESNLERELLKKVERGDLTPEKVEAMDRGLDMDFEEWTSVRNLVAEASASGTFLELDAANHLHVVLGGSSMVWNDQELHLKYICMEVFRILIKQLRPHAVGA